MKIIVNAQYARKTADRRYDARERSEDRRRHYLLQGHGQVPELGERVITMDEEIAEQQADITRLLLHHVQATYAGNMHIRGVLPVPAPAEAVRVVTGCANISAPGRLMAYEMPLRAGDHLLTAYDITGILRTLTAGTAGTAGTHLYPSDRISSVMGMTLVQVAPADAEVATLTGEDNALTILRTIADPFTEELLDPRLRGFLFLDQDRLRLYLDTHDATGVIAADVRPSGAVTALLAALPTLITEEERRVEDSTDPHCSYVVDLTSW
ncbi:hypothetical protein [Streptomyces sp. NPDC051218]|uniref:hypothetical protein n=1 Tax=Streptomyces sp. NPDC051218 TaxID=3365645 RepID=UPI0037B698FA